MSWSPVFEAAKHWEVLAVIGAYLFRTFIKQASASEDADKAIHQEDMSLTARGWEKQKKRLGDG